MMLAFSLALRVSDLWHFGGIFTWWRLLDTCCFWNEKLTSSLSGRLLQILICSSAMKLGRTYWAGLGFPYFTFYIFPFVAIHMEEFLLPSKWAGIQDMRTGPHWLPTSNGHSYCLARRCFCCLCMHKNEWPELVVIITTTTYGCDSYWEWAGVWCWGVDAIVKHFNVASDQRMERL